MKKGDILLAFFLILLAVGLYYFYQNLESFDCYVDYTFGNAMSDIEYEFEPEGSLYGKTRIYRFIIYSPKNRLEYYGMNITNGNETVFFQNRTNPEGGSLITTVNLPSENETVTVDRFFKKRCYAEVRL